MEKCVSDLNSILQAFVNEFFLKQSDRMSLYLELKVNRIL